MWFDACVKLRALLRVPMARATRGKSEEGGGVFPEALFGFECGSVKIVSRLELFFLLLF